MTSVPHFYKFQSSIVRTKVIVFRVQMTIRGKAIPPNLSILWAILKKWTVVMTITCVQDILCNYFLDLLNGWEVTAGS